MSFKLASVFLIAGTVIASGQERRDPTSIRDFLEEAARLQEPNAKINDRNHTYGKNTDFGPLSDSDGRISIENYNNPQLAKEALDASGFLKSLPKVVQDGLQGLLPPLAGSIPELVTPKNSLPSIETQAGDLEPKEPQTFEEFFEANQCIAAEDQLYDWLALSQGISAANTAIVSWSRASDFRQKYLVLSDNPFTYQYIGSSNCPPPSGFEAPMPELSKAAAWLVDEVIANGCKGAGGRMSSRGVFIRDLDADGRDDLILSHDGLECGPTKSKSSSCGQKVCESVIYLRRGSTLDHAGGFVGTVVGIDNKAPPVFTFFDHSLAEFSYQWNGNGFSQR